MYTYGVFLVRIPWPESWGVVGPFCISLVAAVVMSYLAGLLIGWMIANLEGTASWSARSGSPPSFTSFL